ncbi:high mobility group box domain-containing protein [Parasitella parasitica]|nr:high mobility group box domain-containing protein [Parasitella parasitica]
MGSVGGGGAESDSEMSISESVISEVKGARKNASATPRKKRDPNAPKGPGNVFFLYCRMERDNIKDEVPNESLGEVTRLLGQKWKALTKEQKQKYYDIYKKEQDEYEVAMKSYTAAGGGIEGAAAVEAAANKIKQDGEGDDHDDKLDMDDEEIDMLQDDDEDDMDDEAIDDDDDLMDGDDDLPKPVSALSPALSHPPAPQISSTFQLQHHLPPPPAHAAFSSIATDQSIPMPETPNNTAL